MTAVTIALLHLAPDPTDVDANKCSIQRGTEAASRAGASLVLMPELALSGYGFRVRIGTDWIPRTQANSMRWASALAAANGLAVIFTAPEYDEEHGRLYNSIMVFASGGNHLATHRKIAVLKLGSESWSSPGTGPTAV